MSADPEVRDLLARSLGWSEAHVSFDDAVRDLPVHLRGARPGGLSHSPWELLEHIRIAQRDILNFSLTAGTTAWSGRPATGRRRPDHRSRRPGSGASRPSARIAIGSRN